MEQVKVLPLLIICVQTAKGFIWNSSTTSISVCVGNTISLDWAYTLESGETHQVTSWTKSNGTGVPVYLATDLVGFSPDQAYVGRLTSIGNAGIQISNATSSDKGTYSIVVVLTSGHKIYKMDATVNVHEIANASCIPTCDSSWKCQIPQACPVQNYIDAVWTVDGVQYPNVFHCSPNNYNKPYNVCAEGDAVTACYRGSPLCREENVCRGPSQCKLELGLGLGLGLGIQIVITIFFVVGIFKYTGYNHAYFFGLVHGVGVGVTFQFGLMIIESLISTWTTSCKLELGCGFGLGSGIPWVIKIIIAVIFVFKSEGNPNRVQLGKGMLTGLLSATVIGIIVVYLNYDNLKPEQTGYKNTYFPGLVYGVGGMVIYEFSLIIIVRTFSIEPICKLEFGLGILLGPGIISLINIIFYSAVEFVFSSEDNPKRVQLGKGILPGLLSATVIGIIVVYLKYDILKPEQTDDKPKPKQTDITPDDNPGTPEGITPDDNSGTPEDDKLRPEQTGYTLAYFIGLVVGVGVGGTFQVGWIIIASLIFTGTTTSCKLELGLGHGLCSFILWIFTIIKAVNLVFFSKNNSNRVELGKGVLTGLLYTTVIGIIVVYLKYDELKPVQTVENLELTKQKFQSSDPRMQMRSRKS